MEAEVARERLLSAKEAFRKQTTHSGLSPRMDL